MRNDQRQVEERDDESAPREPASRESVGDRCTTCYGDERCHRRGQHRQRQGATQFGIADELPNTGHAPRADETDKWRDEEKQKQRRKQRADDRRQR